MKGLVFLAIVSFMLGWLCSWIFYRERISYLQQSQQIAWDQTDFWGKRHDYWMSNYYYCKTNK